ncbi:DNA-binding response regulator, NarL/FixJ family, contains REC and HTH domains [Lentzea fradiae]|uniref:DNA-binding response regulator, NarL/FixJ family, contains REC and HTH domains n=1 Tax=Lentzea fradiae TaxID=200378 RepID=A0A1G7M519_9PSEU|nr:response regulator transcription factor [Lentzea fradiae]SDF56898.1 DNA-binding response regulator, NarL/FixJ family, contains REC and HTH domains [Lentzea fradiae]
MLPPGRPAPGIALIDPVPLYREGLCALVRRAPGLRWLGSAGDLHSAVRLHARLRPDLLLVDSLIDPGGHLTRLLVDRDPALLVIGLVRDAHAHGNYLTVAREAGVSGVVPRSAQPGQVMRVIAETCRARGFAHPDLRAKERPVLTRREYEVLTLIAEGLENQQVAAELVVSVETVRSHVKGILRKLSARDRTHAVSLAYRSGLLLSGPSALD